MYYYYSLDMGSLGEHVESMHALKGITCLNEMFQVAGEGARVTGDVDDLLWVEVNQSLFSFCVETRAGWIQHDQVDRFDLLHELGQYHLNRAFIKADVLKLVQVTREIEAG